MIATDDLMQRPDLTGLGAGARQRIWDVEKMIVVALPQPRALKAPYVQIKACSETTTFFRDDQQVTGVQNRHVERLSQLATTLRTQDKQRHASPALALVQGSHAA